MIDIANRKKEELKIPNLVFSIQDAYNLDFESGRFDIAIIMNALHIMSEPERALASLQRVPKPRGILIAPTYCHGCTLVSHVFSRLMRLTGFRAHHRWSADSFKEFLINAGFDVIDYETFPAPIPSIIAVTRKSVHT